MVSSFTPRNRLAKQATGDNASTWGDVQSAQDFDPIDTALDGWSTVALVGNVTLTSANGAADQSRARTLKFTGAGPFTVTVPSVEKHYIVWNACAAALTLTIAAASVVVQAGEVASVITDGVAAFKRVQPTDFGAQRVTSVADPTGAQDAATKAYVDATAFATQSGSFPAQAGNAGKVLGTNGVNPGWVAAASAAAGLASLAAGTITVTAATVSDVRTGTSATTGVTPASLVGSAAYIALTDAATIAWDANNGFNAKVTLGGNRIIGAPTNLKDGVPITFHPIQDVTGSRAPTWDTIWEFATGTPTLSTAAGKEDKVWGQYNAARNKIEANFQKAA